MRNVLRVLCLMVLVVRYGTLGLQCKESENCRTNEDDTQYEIITLTPKPAKRPESLSMVSEDEVAMFRPTPLISTHDEPKGRSLNFTMDDHEHNNDLSKNMSRNGTKKKVIDLSDVDIDNDDDEEMEPMDAEVAAINPKIIPSPNKTLSICEKGGLTYENGEKLEVGCDSICTCSNGKMDCLDRCTLPYFKKGKKMEDPLCVEQPAPNDNCCATLSCSDTATEAIEFCTHKNKTYNRGDTIRNDCEQVCQCAMGGKISCKDRCETSKRISDSCVEVPDPDDSCCKKVLCDVNHTKHRITSAKYVNESTIKVEFDSEPDDSHPLIDLSNDKLNWTTFTLLPGDYLHGIDGRVKYIRVENDDDIMEIQNIPRPEIKPSKPTNGQCSFNSIKYKIGEQFNDECKAVCVCKETGVKCLKLECPTYFGTDIIDPHCTEWETVPANFTPVAPNCCPEKLSCKNNGSCLYEGISYDNFQEIPTNLTGCEKRCYCEMGEIECQKVCAHVPASPPSNLPCPPNQAILQHRPGDDCCLEWMCQHVELPPEQTTTLDVSTTEKMKPTEPLDSNNMTDEPFFDSSSPQTKVPSKTHGPLLIYENSSGAVTSPFKPNISENENIYYSNKPKPGKTKPYKDMGGPGRLPSNSETYAGPFNPTYPVENKDFGRKPSKLNKTKEEIHQMIPYGENYIPEQYPSSGYDNNKQVQNNDVHIHGKGPPEELLQIIQQHPELANYPPGSVLEIHNIPQAHAPKPHFTNPNTIHENPVGPYLINQGHQGPINSGVSIEHLLHQFKNTKPFPDFAQNHYPQQTGHLYVQPTVFSGQPQRNYTQGIGFPPGFPNIPGFTPAQSQDEIIIHSLEAVDPYTIRLAFEIPHIIVGLYGRVEVRYTHTNSKDPNNWELQVFAPPEDLLATPQLEFELTDLLPDTKYQIKVSITLRDMHNTPSSKIHEVRTPAALPAMIPIMPDLSVPEVNSTWAIVSWRKFTDTELQYIDGVQLRYRVIDGKIFDATTLIHRAVTSYTLENLKPQTTYEVGIYFIPFTNQRTELRSENMIQFTTANEMDAYGFNVSLEIIQVKPTSVEIAWKGVPYPEDKYVNIYRAIYQSDSGKGDYSTFKVAKREAPSKTVIMDLKPGTRYRLWLEIYLTNGRIKTSNVQDFITKPGSAPVLGASARDKLSGDLSEEGGDYYGPLVIVAILATLAILSTLVLLLILVRRHSTNKASITPPPRVSQSAYDNPTYKVEIQQETMGL